MSTERPILFSGPMVRAIQEDRKTETRRVVKRPHRRKLHEATDFYPADRWWVGQHPNRHWLALDIPGGPPAHILDHIERGDVEGFPCPYGQPGDLLWVRETFRLEHRADFGDYYIRHAGLSSRTNLSFCNLAGEQRDHLAEMAAKDRWERAAGRLENGDPLPLWLGRWRPSIHMPKWACRLWLRVDEVWVERLQEIDREGAIAEGAFDAPDHEKQQAARVALSEGRHEIGPRDYFRELWDTINGKRAPWSANPWVWVVRFSRTEAPDA